MAKKRNQRLIDQAALQSLVRFGPQLDAVDELVKSAQGTFGASVGAANVAAESAKSAIKGARKPLARVYDEAGLTQMNANAALGAPNQLVSEGLQGLSGPGVDTIKAGALAEAHMAATHLNEGKVQALQDLTNRGIQAEAGRQSAVLAAGARLHDDISQIARTKLSLTGQQGAFEAATLGDLLETRADRRFTAGQKAADRRNARILNDEDNATSTANTQARIKAQAVKDAANAKKGLLPNGVKKATPLQHGSARDAVELALTQAKRLKQSGRSRTEIAQLLTEGRSPQTIDDGKGGKAKVPGVSKVPQLLAKAALDLMYHGFVSKKTRRLLNARGLTVKGMGYPGPNSPKAKGYAARKAAEKAVAPIGQAAVWDNLW